MYDPRTRLHAFYPIPAEKPRPEKPEKPEKPKDRAVKIMKRKRQTRTVLAHVVTESDAEDERKEFQGAERVALGTAPSENRAKQFARAFGNGNMLVYVVRHSYDHAPHFVEIGVTIGCSIINTEHTWKMRGAWTVIATPPTISRYHVHNMTDKFNAFLHWDITPMTSLVQTRTSFARQLIADVTAVNDASRDLITQNPKNGRMVALIKYMLTFSTPESVGLLHEMGISLHSAVDW